MEKNKLLVCISFHNVPEKIKYLKMVIKRLNSYFMDVRIIIDTNSLKGMENIEGEVIVHIPSHPYHLTYLHREHFAQNINKYDWFMYLEDDMDIPYENFVNYRENFYILWPEYVPSFVRIEEREGKKYVTDVTSQQEHLTIIEKSGKRFVSLKQPYHAFWIMPQKELKETLTKNFVRLDTWREMASSYPMWELKKTPLVQLGEDGQISSLCYSFHLTNNYVNCPHTAFAKIEINQLLT